MVRHTVRTKDVTVDTGLSDRLNSQTEECRGQTIWVVVGPRVSSPSVSPGSTRDQRLNEVLGTEVPGVIYYTHDGSRELEGNGKDTGTPFEAT